MTKQEFASRLQNACAAVTAAEQELTEIDSRFGDADHGLTMSKIAKAVSAAAGRSQRAASKSMLDDAAMAVMVPERRQCRPPVEHLAGWSRRRRPPRGRRSMWRASRPSSPKRWRPSDDMSGAKVGDKTMMDALIPASQAIAAYSGSDEAGLFDAAAQAALQGAEASKQFVSKFGRAKSYGEQTIGTPDAGAASMAYFFQGLARP